MKTLTLCIALVAATFTGLPCSPSHRLDVLSTPAPLTVAGGDDRDDNDTSDEDFTAREQPLESLAA